MSLFKVNYRDIAPSGDVIGRGDHIEANTIGEAQAIAARMTRASEVLESVREVRRG